MNFGLVLNSSKRHILCMLILSRSIRASKRSDAKFRASWGWQWTSTPNNSTFDKNTLNGRSLKRNKCDAMATQIDVMESVMKEVYGNWDDPKSGFPIPMPRTEAGPDWEPNAKSPTCQRRYLWTDSFGILNFITLSHRAQSEEKRQKLLDAAQKLADVTEKTLGTPRSDRLSMLPNSSGGYKGMRIGKEEAKVMSDAGMSYDGMYWHYIDKWIYANLRLSQAKGETPSYIAEFIKEIHPYFLKKDKNGQPVGIYWKMNCDLSVIDGLEDTEPNQDAFDGWLMYNLVHRVYPILEKEIKELEYVVKNYVESGLRATSDPLGYGLIWWSYQWVKGWKVEASKQQLKKLASMALDIRHGRQLPFRLYGAIIGGKLSMDSNIVALANKSLDHMKEYEMNNKIGSPHSTINKIMFATAFDPFAFKKYSDDTIFEV